MRLRWSCEKWKKYENEMKLTTDKQKRTYNVVWGLTIHIVFTWLFRFVSSTTPFIKPFAKWKFLQMKKRCDCASLHVYRSLRFCLYWQWWLTSADVPRVFKLNADSVWFLSISSLLTSFCSSIIVLSLSDDCLLVKISIVSRPQASLSISTDFCLN